MPMISVSISGAAPLSPSYGRASIRSHLNNSAPSKEVTATIKIILIRRKMPMTNASTIDVTISSMKINPMAIDRDLKFPTCSRMNPGKWRVRAGKS